MTSKLRAHPILTTAFALSTALALFLLVRAVFSFVCWQSHQNEPIRPWMTVGYIDNSWGLTPDTLDMAAEFPEPRKGQPLTLTEIAQIENVSVEAVISQVEAALVKLGARQDAASQPDQKPSE